MLTFLNLLWQWKGPKKRPLLCSPVQVHITTPAGSIPEAPEIWVLPCYEHTVVAQWCLL